MKKVILPSFLKPSGSFELIRLGSKHDGGYLVDIRDVKKVDALLSLGINNDWSFEKHFLKLNKVQLQAFDGSVNFFQLIKLFFRSRFSLRSLSAILTFKTFFSKNKIFNKLYVGYDNISDNFISLNTLINDYSNNSQNFFLKIDIEGWEYRILDEIIEFQDKISGLVIEFHDIDLHLNKIKSFINRLDLEIAHCHCNNYGPLAINKMPTTIEITFSSHKSISKEVQLPHELDYPNNPKNQDFKISFHDNQ